MSHAAAFALRDGTLLATYGGSTHLRDGLSLNIGQALTEGKTDQHPNGLIVTDDPLVSAALQARWDLQPVVPPADAKITSHQLAPTTSQQHARDRAGVPALAFATGHVYDSHAAGIPAVPAAVPAGSAIPLPTGQAAADRGEQPGHPDVAPTSSTAAPTRS